MKNTITIGWSQKDITPKGGAISLAGQWEERITKEIHDPIYATAMVVKSAAGRTIWVACDLVAIRQELLELVIERLGRMVPNFKKEELILSATHIHTGPNTDDDTLAALFGSATKIDGVLTAKECREQIAAVIEEGVLAALDSMEESRLELSYSFTITGLNRRAMYKDGTSIMYGDVHRADFTGMEGRDGGPMQLVYVRRTLDNKLTGIIAAVPCTAQVDEQAPYVTADYWQTTREIIRDGLGKDVHVLSLIRSSGDLSPHTMVDGAKGLERIGGLEGARILGKRIGDAIVQAADNAFYTAQGNVPYAHLCTTIELPLWPITQEQKDWAKEHLDKNGGTKPVGLNGMMEYANAVDYFKQMSYDKETYPCTLHAVRIGDIVWITNPFELFIEYADRIRAGVPQATVIDVELAGDTSLGYLATQKAIDRGGYSALRFSGRTNAEGGEKVVAASINLIKNIMN